VGSAVGSSVGLLAGASVGKVVGAVSGAVVGVAAGPQLARSSAARITNASKDDRMRVFQIIFLFPPGI